MSFDIDSFMEDTPDDSETTLAGRDFFPLTAPGMPLPGPDFIDQATVLGDAKLVLVGKGKDKRIKACGNNLNTLYRKALYLPNFSLKTKVKHFSAVARYVPGHVFGQRIPSLIGPRQCKVMVVGKWPGTEETVSGYNFHPDSKPTKALVSILRTYFGPGSEHHIPEDGPLGWKNWYVTNVVRHTNLDPTSNTVAASWIKNCAVLLEQELRLVRPDYIICFGTEAVAAILGKGTTIGATTGKTCELTICMKRTDEDETPAHVAKVRTCTHPAALASSSEKMPEFVEGLKGISSMLSGKEIQKIQFPKTRVIIKDVETLRKTVDEVIAHPEGTKIAMDCEWEGGSPWCANSYLRTIQFSYKDHWAAAIVLRGEMERSDPNDWLSAVPGAPAPKIFPDESVVRDEIFRMLRGRPDKQKVRIVGHNFKADLMWLKYMGIDVSPEFMAPEDDPDVGTNPEAFEGWVKTIFEGGFDTMLAAHAVDETAEFKLELLCSRYLGTERWDLPVDHAKKLWCQRHHIGVKAITGYGFLPENIILPYSMDDVDYGRQLEGVYNQAGGLLDKDIFGNCSRKAFWVSMKANPAFLEMECTGLALDKARFNALVAIYDQVYDTKLEEFRAKIKWGDFNPNSSTQCVALLFGDKYARKFDKKTGKPKQIVPEASSSLGLTPIVTTGKPPKQWSEVVAKGKESFFVPSAGGSTLSILAFRLSQDPSKSFEASVLKDLRSLKFIGKTLTGVLARPLESDDDDSDLAEPEYEKGMISYVQDDGRVRTHFYQTKETGRASSSDPATQNLSAKREADYEEICGDMYRWPLRSVFCSSPGYVYVENDLSGAELFVLAAQSGDKVMLDHCVRNNLPEDHENYYDIHSAITAKAFKLNCAPTKAGLKKLGKAHLRKAAKAIVFGLLYARGMPALIRAIEEENVSINMKEAEAIRDAIFGTYTRAEPYLLAAGDRAINPRHLCNALGRRRRFYPVPDGPDANKQREELKRQARNFGIQSLVADYVSIALSRLHAYPGRVDEKGFRYKIALQIHDAILSEVRIDCLEWYLNTVIKDCFTSVEFQRCNFDGNPISPELYRMGCGKELSISWGEKIDKNLAKTLGIPLECL